MLLENNKAMYYSKLYKEKVEEQERFIRETISKHGKWYTKLKVWLFYHVKWLRKFIRFNEMLKIRSKGGELSLKLYGTDYKMPKKERLKK